MSGRAKLSPPGLLLTFLSQSNPQSCLPSLPPHSGTPPLSRAALAPSLCLSKQPQGLGRLSLSWPGEDGGSPHPCITGGVQVWNQIERMSKPERILEIPHHSLTRVSQLVSSGLGQGTGAQMPVQAGCSQNSPPPVHLCFCPAEPPAHFYSPCSSHHLGPYLNSASSIETSPK